MGRPEQLEPVGEIVGTIPLDEEYQQECLEHVRSFWKTKLEDRYAALGQYPFSCPQWWTTDRGTCGRL